MNKVCLAAAILVAASAPALAMVNPASALCVEMGGELELTTDASGGAIGLCHLPDGRIIEEWTLFRLYHAPAAEDEAE
jgi:putative hemolysin